MATDAFPSLVVIKPVDTGHRFIGVAFADKGLLQGNNEFGSICQVMPYPVGAGTAVLQLHPQGAKAEKQQVQQYACDPSPLVFSENRETLHDKNQQQGSDAGNAGKTGR